MSDSAGGPDAVSGSEALAANRKAQAAKMAAISRCMREAQEIAADDRVSLQEAQTQVRELRRLRNRANEALRELEDDERSLVQNSRYAKEAVDALLQAAKDLKDEVEQTARIAGRTATVGKAIGKVAGASEAVLSKVMG